MVLNANGRMSTLREEIAMSLMHVAYMTEYW